MPSHCRPGEGRAILESRRAKAGSRELIPAPNQSHMCRKIMKRPEYEERQQGIMGRVIACAKKGWPVSRTRSAMIDIYSLSLSDVALGEPSLHLLELLDLRGPAPSLSRTHLPTDRTSQGTHTCGWPETSLLDTPATSSSHPSDLPRMQECLCSQAFCVTESTLRVIRASLALFWFLQ